MSEQLERAYQFIEDGRDDEALEILRPYVEDNPNDARGWWLLSYATDNPSEARLALINTLKNDPYHQQAQTMLDELNTVAPPSKDEQRLLEDLTGEDIDVPPNLVVEDRYDEDDDLMDSFLLDVDEPPQTVAVQEKNSASFLQLVLAAVLLVVIVFLAVTLLQNVDEADTGRSDLDDLDSQDPPVALAGLNLGDGSEAVFSETSLGETFFVQSCICVSATCNGPSPDELPQIVIDSFQTARAQVERANATGVIDALGVNIVDCSNDDTLYQVYIPLEDVPQAPVTLSDLQERWTVKQ